MNRIIAGFVACAFTLPLVSLIIAANPALAGLTAFVTCNVTVFAGMPLYYCFLRHRWFSLWHALAAGAVAGCVVALPFVAISRVLPDIRTLAALAFVGALHGALFWLVAIVGNVDLANGNKGEQTP